MRRVPELDALRAFAAGIILLYHLRFMEQCPLWQSGVDLFFVLSGYLITTILVHGERSGSFLRSFYIRRTLRIWPAYYLALGICLVVNPLLPRPEPLDGLGQYLSYTQFVQRYWGAEPPLFSRMFHHTWTLAIEEQFYLVWPLLVRLVRGRAAVGLMSLGLVAVPVALRGWGVHGSLLLTRCDGLALGALLAALLTGPDGMKAPSRYVRAALVGLVVTMLGVPLWRGWVLEVAGRVWGGGIGLTTLGSLQVLRLNLLFFALVGLVVLGAGRPWLFVLRRPRLVYAGRISYGLYLYHPIVYALVTVAQRGLGMTGSVGIDALKVVLSVAVAALSWRYVEEPILRWKERFTYGRAAAPSSALKGPHVPVGGPIAPGRDAVIP